MKEIYRRQRSRKSGSTLIELLVVIAILMALLLPVASGRSVSQRSGSANSVQK